MIFLSLYNYSLKLLCKNIKNIEVFVWELRYKAVAKEMKNAFAGNRDFSA